MLAWGNRHFPPDQQTVRIVNTATGEAVDPVLADPKTGLAVDGPGYAVVNEPMARRRAAARSHA